MTGRTHDLAAAALLAVAALYADLPSMSVSTIVIALLANQLGGIAPDIDQPTAPFWRNLPIGPYIGKHFNDLLGGHRFITHSVIGLALIGYGVHFLLIFLKPILGSIDTTIVWWSFMIGALSHLVMDSFTKEGVPWLLPLPIKIGFPPVRHWRVSTGKRVERWIVFPGLILASAILLINNYQAILVLLRTKIH